MDELTVQPAFHSAVGGLVVLAALAAAGLNWRAARIFSRILALCNAGR